MKTLADGLYQQAILGRISGLSSSDVAKWGRMSVHQMICHLSDSFCIALGEKTASPATGFLQRALVKPISLWVPLPWKHGYPTRPEVEQGKGGSRPVEFDADRNTLKLVVRRFCESLPQPCLPHPVFGPMQAHEWWRWGYLHADHHLRQFGR